ncbi:MAG TPA: EAL domain-containing protein, partial [Usitatibacter sp.]|nr:EAL domain-containing protein [Usitatibacter sp.]
RGGHAVLRNYRKDGTLFWNEYSIAPVRDDTGEVRHFVGVMNDVTEAKTYEQQLAHQANFDTLTGLANRNLLQDRLNQAIAGARRTGGTVAAVFLDIDNFKMVNDSLGHTVGDEMLRRVAARLKSCVRESDTVARLGGDEFVLVLNARREAASGSLEMDVTSLMHKLLTNVSNPLTLGERPVRPTCSIGIAIYPQDGEDADTLLRNADAAMYRAKDLGRNRFQFFTADVHERIRRRMELETSLRHALERDEFELHYQPQVGIAEGGIQGVEALVRWRHPQMGLIPPGHFISFAEETGLIVPIGEWVLRRACAQNKAWQDAGLPKIPIAVNMSAKQCEQDDVDEMVRRALQDTGLDPRYLELEITESISMANPEQSVPLMQRLKDTGVSLSIDDFGTGFSNLSYLRRFPVDRLKIDLSFVREITTDPGSLAISEAIITMSHSLNLQVVAEGVENEGQLQLLGARNCDMMQGFLYSPPVPAEAFARMLREDRRLAYVPHGSVQGPTALTH